ncbi:hypothetical protein ABTZ03_39630 [Kitasatospora sp. NPDC096077]|uniref:hypothetical protein n=1 Tax=Kitasatospora sp. NPDC096077 TaxID=3155544 RepID=UPI00332AB58F
MRANHATEPQEPAPSGDTGARRAVARWLPRPRTVAAGGALLVQLWGIGAPGAYAATAEPSPGQPGAAVRRALHGPPALDGPSAVRPGGPGGPGGDGGLVGGLTDGAAPGGEVGTVGEALQERIRAGGLPLPGQGAALPDAFALASGLLGTVPAQDRPDRTRASREGEPTALPAVPRPRAGGPADPAGRTGPAPTGTPAVQETAAREGTVAPEPVGAAGAAAPSAAPAAPTGDGTAEALALADTATVTAAVDGSATATAVLAPIAAGLLLTGAAMCKHRGLPRGH